MLNETIPAGIYPDQVIIKTSSLSSHTEMECSRDSFPSWLNRSGAACILKDSPCELKCLAKSSYIFFNAIIFC